MRFIADSMLGRPARWLRLLGYDTVYYPDIDDSFLLRIAREEKRILLTRDTRLVKVKGIGSFLLIKSNDPFGQLKEIISEYNLYPLQQTDDLNRGGADLPRHFYGRCSLCNSLLVEVPKDRAAGRVPEYVYQTTERFMLCDKCDKFYWEGTHHALFLKKLFEIL